jgi:hypothetical protein
MGPKNSNAGVAAAGYVQNHSGIALSPAGKLKFAACMTNCFYIRYGTTLIARTIDRYLYGWHF